MSLYINNNFFYVYFFFEKSSIYKVKLFNCNLDMNNSKKFFSIQYNCISELIHS